MKKAIVWFTTDLRIHDNETLYKAIQENDEVWPVYCLDPRNFEQTEYGTRKTGSFRAEFLLESLKDLDKNLRALGSGLFLLKGKPELVLPDFVRLHAIDKIYTQKQIAYEELSVQNKLIKALNCCEHFVFESNSLYQRNDLPFQLENMPLVFTESRKRIEKYSQVRSLFSVDFKIKSPEIKENEWPNLQDFNLEIQAKDQRAAFDFKGGETAALNRLNTYLYATKALSTYKATRNGMVGENYSSKFSAALALGCLSAKKIYHEIKAYEQTFAANESTYWLVFELMWRDYFRLMMEKYPIEFFQKNGIKPNSNVSYRQSEKDFERWKNGQTDCDFVNANMLELKYTGFMSNRGRQNVASYLCHDLKLDWRLGAAYFEEVLIDYDVSSNWCNWAYVAGVGNDPRARIFNMEKQSKMYDPDCAHRKLWLR